MGILYTLYYGRFTSGAFSALKGNNQTIVHNLDPPLNDKTNTPSSTPPPTIESYFVICIALVSSKSQDLYASVQYVRSQLGL